MSDEYYMEIALQEAEKAYRAGDVPVGAVIVCEDKVIAKNHNKKEKNQNAINHAEILVIEEACNYYKNWHLENCTLYVTLEPCLMCAGAIIQSRIKKIVYATSSPKFGYVESISKLENERNNHIPIMEKGILEERASEILKDFFKNKRG